MRIFFFGSLGDRIGREVEIERPEGLCDISGLRRLLARQFPEARDALESASVRACVDDVIVADDHVLDGSVREVQFFPPLSGG